MRSGDEVRRRWNDRHRQVEVGGSHPSAWLVEHRALLERQPKGRALDIACGRGRNAFLLAELGFTVDAIDISDVAVEAVAARAAELGAPVRAVRADVPAEPFPAPPYEVVVNVHFLERALFAPIAEALAPGGLLVFETFGRDHVDVLGRDFNPEYTLAHNELLRAFAGLRVLRYRDAIVDGGRPRAVVGMVARREG